MGGGLMSATKEGTNIGRETKVDRVRMTKIIRGANIETN